MKVGNFYPYGGIGGGLYLKLVEFAAPLGDASMKASKVFGAAI